MVAFAKLLENATSETLLESDLALNLKCIDVRPLPMTATPPRHNPPCRCPPLVGHSATHYAPLPADGWLAKVIRGGDISGKDAMKALRKRMLNKDSVVRAPRRHFSVLLPKSQETLEWFRGDAMTRTPELICAPVCPLPWDRP